MGLNQMRVSTIFIFSNEGWKPYEAKGGLEGSVAVLSNYEDQDKAFAMLGIEPVYFEQEPEYKTTHFESRNRYDYLSISIQDFQDWDTGRKKMEVYMTRDIFLLVADDEDLGRCRSFFLPKTMEDARPSQMISLLLNQMLFKNSHLLDEIEDGIEALEEKVSIKNPDDYSGEIIDLRKRLLNLKRYFEGLYDALEDLEENQNGFFYPDELKVFRLYKNKADRLLRNVINLRDYLTQVREAYQNQLDLSLNDTMRFFTVIASIFLPLTLVVGWYGMNLKMPEFESEIAYGVVILGSILYVVASVIYAKKKGWFR